MGSVPSIHKVLVVGLRDAGKTHFLHMFTFGPDTTKNHTHGYDFATIDLSSRHRIDMTECTNLKALQFLPTKFTTIFLVVDPSGTFEELSSAKNILLQVLTEHCTKICIIYNLKPNTKRRFSFRQCNMILQLNDLQHIVPTSAVELQFENHPSWTEKMTRVFDWVTSSAI